MFYNEDNTVKNVYKRMYLLGRTSQALRNVSDQNSDGDTGGEKQENPADYIELMAAMAAYHFIEACSEDKPFSQQDEKFFCIGHDYGNGILDFPMFGQKSANILKQKMGIALAASLLSLSSDTSKFVLYDFFKNVSNGRGSFMTDVVVDGPEMTALKRYFELFSFSVDKDEQLVKGWLPQMYAGRPILFDKDLFSRVNFKDLKSFELDSKLYFGENPPSFKVARGLSSHVDRTMETIKKTFEVTLPECSSHIFHLLERTYATLMKLYFSDNR